MRIAPNILFVFATLFLPPMCNRLLADNNVLTDSVCSHIIYFKHNSSVVDSGYIDNNKVLKSIGLLLNDKNLSKRIKSINITGMSSPDGVYEHNIKLAMKRMRALKGYFVWKYPHLDQNIIYLNNGGENWKGLLDCVTKDPDVPYREKVIEIINQDINTGTKKWRLQHIGNGTAWEYIEKNIIKRLRSASTSISIIIEKNKEEGKNESGKEGKEELQSAIISDTLKTNQETVTKSDTYNQERIINTNESSHKEQTFLALKTNLAAYVFGVANIAVEIPFAQKLSLDIPVYYSPYTLAQNYKFRLLAFEPELKYWFKQPFKGHSIGIHGAAVMYNIAFNDRDRFQNTNGEDFVYGGGISYGYTMKLKKNWNIEFTAGFGYLHLNHDVFRNVENGALYDNRKFHYWGPTKLGINIIYLFNKR